MDVGAITNQAGSSGQSAATLAKDFDNFLQLLTTQLQYQDPLAPMDSNQFTQQLVSFTGVEQSIATNKNLESIIAQNQSLSATNTVGYLGKEVTISSDKAGVRDDGSVQWEYALSASSTETKITVKDQNGLKVHEESGSLSNGLHEFSWSPEEGAPKEIYTLEVVATAGEGKTVESRIYSKGIVDSLETVNGEVLLAANGLLTAPTNVLTVKEVIAQLTTPPAEDGTE